MRHESGLLTLGGHPNACDCAETVRALCVTGPAKLEPPTSLAVSYRRSTQPSHRGLMGTLVHVVPCVALWFRLLCSVGYQFESRSWQRDHTTHGPESKTPDTAPGVVDKWLTLHTDSELCSHPCVSVCVIRERDGIYEECIFLSLFAAQQQERLSILLWAVVLSAVWRTEEAA